MDQKDSSSLTPNNGDMNPSLCDKKKLAPFDVVQALKAHCLERLNKHDEALAICHVVMKNKPTDDRALHILPIVLRQCGALLEELIPVYAHAFRISKREEVGQLLFFAHVRAFEFQQQQQVALQLYKLTGERKFVYWSGLSILMQVTFRQTPEKMLDLAIKMVEKVVRESRESSSESLMLLLDLQLARGYVEAAWSTYTTYINHESSRSGSSSPELQQVKDNKPKPRAREGEAGYEGEEVSLGPMQRLDRLVLGAKLASRLGQWTEASRLYRELLSEHNGDDWMFLLGYVRAMMEHTEDLEEVRLFILELQTKCPTNRGPHLILCELVKDNPSALSAALEQYMERFGAKSCCFSDLRQYLDRIKESSEPFVQYLNARAEAHRLTSVDEGTEGMYSNRFKNIQKFKYIQLYSVIFKNIQKYSNRRRFRTTWSETSSSAHSSHVCQNPEVSQPLAHPNTHRPRARICSHAPVGQVNTIRSTRSSVG